MLLCPISTKECKGKVNVFTPTRNCWGFSFYKQDSAILSLSISMTDTTFKDYVVEDLFASVRGITARAMFGGFGIYREGVIFAIIIDDELYFKVDATTQKRYEDLGSHPFTYGGKEGKPYTMSYWFVDEQVQENGELFLDLADEAFAISKKSKIKKK